MKQREKLLKWIKQSSDTSQKITISLSSIKLES